ncbi:MULTISPECIES: hypothetical protein [Streptomyces]|uniref:hypothetical protein n=1 Tax=Streptomyces TaxID=1883 RepID=UPI00201D1CAD|nr:hypothetical protein [Streptomyces panaciradicis]MCL6673747.1 hypothetical protein [Streptomyces panaciradicis]
MNSVSLRRAAGITAASVVAAASCLMAAGSADAATAHQFTLCSDGYYDSYAYFPARNFSTTIVNPGTCTTLYFGDSGAEAVQLYEGNGRYIGGFYYEKSTGTGVSTTGTASSPGYYRW